MHILAECAWNNFVEPILAGKNLVKPTIVVLLINAYLGFFSEKCSQLHASYFYVCLKCEPKRWNYTAHRSTTKIVILEVAHYHWTHSMCIRTFQRRNTSKIWSHKNEKIKWTGDWWTRNGLAMKDATKIRYFIEANTVIFARGFHRVALKWRRWTIVLYKSIALKLFKS